MKTSNGIDINYDWYLDRPIASAGSTVGVEAGSVVVLDNAFDWSHGLPHLNIRVRVASEGNKPKGKKVQYILGDEHSVNLFQPGSPSI